MIRLLLEIAALFLLKREMDQRVQLEKTSEELYNKLGTLLSSVRKTKTLSDENRQALDDILTTLKRNHGSIRGEILKQVDKVQKLLLTFKK